VVRMVMFGHLLLLGECACHASLPLRVSDSLLLALRSETCPPFRTARSSFRLAAVLDRRALSLRPPSRVNILISHFSSAFASMAVRASSCFSGSRADTYAQHPFALCVT
jgi:hypothetical protein